MLLLDCFTVTSYSTLHQIGHCAVIQRHLIIHVLLQTMMSSSYLFSPGPQAAIPKGTLLAIIITGVTYLGVALCVGEHCFVSSVVTPLCKNVFSRHYWQRW